MSQYIIAKAQRAADLEAKKAADAKSADPEAKKKAAAEGK